MICGNKGMNTCMACLKREQSLLKGLSHAELELLDRDRYVINYRKGETICKEGMKPQGLLCLNAGRVKITRAATNGTEQIVGLKKPVDFVDIRALMTGSVYHHSAVALEDSSVCIIEGNDFQEIVRTNPGLSLSIIRAFARELDKADERFVNMTQKHLRARLAETILSLRDFYGTLPDNKIINCEMKRADLAGLSNMSTANVIRTISDFTKEGILESEGKRLSVLDEKKLKAIGMV